MTTTPKLDQLDMQCEMALRQIRNQFDTISQAVSAWEPRPAPTKEDQ